MPVTAEVDFVVMACDGIWEVLNSQQVVDFIYQEKARRVRSNKIVENLLDKVISPNIQRTGK